MRLTKVAKVLVSASCLCLSAVAYAGFNNGGFESGDLSGWTVNYGNNYGVSDLNNPVASIGFSGWDYPAYGTPAGVVPKGSSDTYLPSLGGVITDNYAARLNDLDGDYHVTQISQTGVIDASDLTGGATSADLYINWAGIMDDPGHPRDAEPWFIVDVLKNGNPFFREIQYADTAAGGGWTQTGYYPYSGDAVWAKSGQVHLTGLDLGDSVTVNLTVADCAYGGHGAYAYLDGIGTAYVPPPPPPTGVPDCGATALLLVPTLASLGFLRRRLS
jgi:hypothetical protein